jgi:hypothetical protein
MGVDNLRRRFSDFDIIDFLLQITSVISMAELIKISSNLVFYIII